MYVRMCVPSYLPPHTLESQKRGTNGFCAIQVSFKFVLPIFLKMLRSKVMAYYAYLEQLRRPSAFFPHEISFYAGLKPIATFSLHGPVEDSVRVFGTDS